MIEDIIINCTVTQYYYIKNVQGDIIGIVDTLGNKVVEYTYNAWGYLRYTTGSLADTLGVKNHLRYRGYYYDVETGFYYLQSRYYDPRTGRFINADDTDFIGADGSFVSYNLFAYCNNNPIMNSDPSGQFVVRRWMVAAAIDALLMLIPGIGGMFASVKYVAKSFGKSALKAKLNTPFVAFIKFVARNAKKLIQGFQKVVKKIPCIGYKIAKKIPVNKLVSMVAGVTSSVTVNKLLNIMVENIDMLLSLGGIISGILDYAFDKKFNNSIWVI